MKVKLTIVIEGDISDNGIHPRDRDDIYVTIDLLSSACRRRLKEDEIKTLRELMPDIIDHIPQEDLV